MRIILATNTSKTTVKKVDGKYQINGIPVTVDNAIMNGIKYTAEENAKGMSTLNKMPMSLTHPEDEDGRNVSIFSPSGIDFYSGGKVTNTYNKNGVWYADSEIDEKKLRASEQGEYFANRLDGGEPIGVSTGLTFEANNQGGEGYSSTAINQKYDHLAMLHESERPAGGDATVMRFNGEDVQVVNFDDIEAGEQEDKTESIINRALSAFAKKLGIGYNSQEFDNQQDEDRKMRDLIEAKLKAEGIEVNGLDEAALLAAYNKLQAPKEPEQKPLVNSDDTSAWAQSLVDKVNSLESTFKANAEQELEKAADEVAALDIGINKEAAKAMGLDACNAVLDKQKPTHVNGSFAPGQRQSGANSDELEIDIDVNEGIE